MRVYVLLSLLFILGCFVILYGIYNLQNSTQDVNAIPIKEVDYNTTIIINTSLPDENNSSVEIDSHVYFIREQYLKPIYEDTFTKSLCDKFKKDNLFLTIFEISKFLNDKVKYVPDVGEEILTPKEFYEKRKGDCEDHVIFAMALINNCYDKNVLFVEGNEHVFSLICNVDLNQYLEGFKYLDVNTFEFLFDFKNLKIFTKNFYKGKIYLKRGSILVYNVKDFFDTFEKNLNIKCDKIKLNINTNGKVLFSNSKDFSKIIELKKYIISRDELPMYLGITTFEDKYVNISLDLECYTKKLSLKNLDIHVYDFLVKGNKIKRLTNCVPIEFTRKLGNVKYKAYRYLYPGVGLNYDYLKSKFLNGECKFYLYNKNEVYCVKDIIEKSIVIRNNIE